MSDEVPEPHEVEAFVAAHAAQRGHLRRILLAFLVVVVLLPVVGLGGTLAWLLLLPMLGVAAFGLREAIRLRRSVLRYGNLR